MRGLRAGHGLTSALDFPYYTPPPASVAACCAAVRPIEPSLSGSVNLYGILKRMY